MITVWGRLKALLRRPDWRSGRREIVPLRNCRYWLHLTCIFCDLPVGHLFNRILCNACRVPSRMLLHELGSVSAGCRKIPTRGHRHKPMLASDVRVRNTGRQPVGTIRMEWPRHGVVQGNVSIGVEWGNSRLMQARVIQRNAKWWNKY